MDKQELIFNEIGYFIDNLYSEYIQVLDAMNNIHPILAKRISIVSKDYNNLFITAEFEYQISCSELLKETHSKLNLTKELADTLTQASPEYVKTLSKYKQDLGKDFLIGLPDENYLFIDDKKKIREVLLNTLSNLQYK